ncbi:MAG: hypothetical protein IJ535_09065 [Pseudobutyrivibrio sp.]|uniref:hypothetical protein n=1 Tax=Pseudobutyrivibrio sp. TaxID=2014367 RepID=UPI0025DED700|nr:hypothetical protein [Pseudobutyrivibrio sp.]MBQ8489917.1 hypothetical protein [Pseudobutyrivibrio sp.]
MLNYKIKYIEFNGNVDDIVFDFGEGKDVLSMFLSSDVTPFEEWMKESFDDVLSGKIGTKTVDGNVCSAEISPTNTKIFDMLVEDEGEYYSTCCEVNTKELRQVIDEWCDEVRKFKDKKKNNQ